jgi:peroxiredoxin
MFDGLNLENKKFPKFPTEGTSGTVVSPGKGRTWLVLYVYPMIPDSISKLPDGWFSIPGAAGCTGQSCSFRDHYSGLKKLDAELVGLSSQPVQQQVTAKKRLNLPFELISDNTFNLKRLLGLPTFQITGSCYYERLTLVIRNGVIKKVFYPVPNPETHVFDVFDWLITAGKKNDLANRA